MSQRAWFITGVSSGFGRELTVPEIAEQLRVPEGTVKSRLHSTLGHLHAALDAERRSDEATR